MRSRRTRSASATLAPSAGGSSRSPDPPGGGAAGALFLRRRRFWRLDGFPAAEGGGWEPAPDAPRCGRAEARASPVSAPARSPPCDTPFDPSRPKALSSFTLAAPRPSLVSWFTSNLRSDQRHAPSAPGGPLSLDRSVAIRCFYTRHPFIARAGTPRFPSVSWVQRPEDPRCRDLPSDRFNGTAEKRLTPRHESTKSPFIERRPTKRAGRIEGGSLKTICSPAGE